jgi:O-antigen ligase
LRDAHNSFLNVAAEAGVIGLAAFLALVVYLVRPAIRSFARAGSFAVTKAAGIAFICAFIYQGLTGSFEEARHLWVLAGLLLAASTVEQSDAKIPVQL